jgi:hypothetical protein
MILEKFKTTFTVKKKVWTIVTMNNKQVDRTTEVDGDSFNGHLQQATAEYAQSYNLSLTKGYSLWCPLSANVFEGDIIHQDGTAYTVRARQDYRDGDNPHAQLAVELIGSDYAGS